MVHETSLNSVVPHMLRGGSDQTDRQGIFSRMWTYEGMVHTRGEKLEEPSENRRKDLNF
jgi:hypothetical protein